MHVTGNRGVRALWGLVAALSVVSCLGLAGDRGGRRGSEDIVKAASRGRAIGEALRGHRPLRETVVARLVEWVDIAPDGTVSEGSAEVVRRRPRRLGAVTLLSFEEIVAANVRIRVRESHDRARDSRAAREAPSPLGPVRTAADTLRGLARSPADGACGRDSTLTRTVPGGMVVEGLQLQRGDGPQRWTLTAHRLGTSPGRDRWSLQGLELDAAGGGRLAIEQGEVARDGRLTASGPYVLTVGGRTRRGARGCFLIDLNGPMTFHPLPTLPGASVGCPARGPSPDGHVWVIAPVPPGSGHGAGMVPGPPLLEQVLQLLATTPIPTLSPPLSPAGSSEAARGGSG